MMHATKLNSTEIDQGLCTLDHWALDAHKASIRKEWNFDSFQTAMQFLQKVGEIADRHDHHPEFVSTYTHVRIRLLTHEAYGLTQKDFKLATEIDRLIQHEFSNALKTK